MGKEKKGNSESYALTISQKYYEDLEQIVDYIEFVKFQPLNAIKVGDGIQKTMNKIILNPTIYSECENIPTKSKIYRKASYRSWLIVFKFKGDVVTILGVLSGKRKSSSFRKRK
ncbi:type II toxin-antitoxin system RelE/ParE family toxin [Flavobacterium sp. ZT3R18]|uniref:type II toxin-antitoxin system RelE/ParE family toxin n=1 Tax=Flavobacterium sp. ZT3R18 TaxID=2594429 RepID=UPI00117AD828|nr:type II toxin-antitoxin system RelE/ParE family toxin [Flavobacterium sp. ZT3R18]TRX38060.1 type II toxin-antitoxin system RelE/ParE family toxin [Flavobacterium sp. ZT3R18]